MTGPFFLESDSAVEAENVVGMVISTGNTAVIGSYKRPYLIKLVLHKIILEGKSKSVSPGFIRIFAAGLFACFRVYIIKITAIPK